VANRAGFKPATVWSKGIDSTKAPPFPTLGSISERKIRKGCIVHKCRVHTYIHTYNWAWHLLTIIIVYLLICKIFWFFLMQEKEKLDISIALRLAAGDGRVSVFKELLERNESLNIDMPNDVKKLRYYLDCYMYDIYC